VVDEEVTLLRELVAALEAGTPVALATVVASHRSVPRRAGSKMLVYADGRFTGTVGGGELERRVLAEAAASLDDGRTRLLSYDLVDIGKGDPGVCGGSLQVYVEPHQPPPWVLVVGCGHVGRAVVDLAHWLGFRVAATDDRPEYVTAELLPGADVLAPGSLADALGAVPVDSRTFVVATTRGVGVDVEVLPALLSTPARWIGVIGSQRRWATTRRMLREQGIPAEVLDRVHSPMGVELHAETPREIAVSILAEIISVYREPGPR
jgi:xanthine dehydrogenase accessory factor